MTASPTAVPTPAPSGPAIANVSRPLHDGDTFTYAGSTLQQFVYAGVAPSPASSTLYGVSQSVAVSANKTYAGTSGLYDFKSTEVDTSPLQQSTLTTDTYYGTIPAGAGNTALIQYGYTSVDSRGENIGVTYADPGLANGLVDVFPEQSGAAWSNSGAQTLVQSEASGFSATRTYARDGSYTETANYPQASTAQPMAGPLTATIVTNPDGSGTYALPLFGPPNVTVSYSAPSSTGAIAINFSQPGPTPTSTPRIIQSALVGAWYQQPVRLYQELDRDNGAVAIPAACNVSVSYGTQANQIEQKSVRVDPVFGTLETFDQLTYVVPLSGAVCVQLQDRTLTYYDYSGQSNGAPNGISFSGGNTPLETATVSTTIGLTSSKVAPLSVQRSTLEGASGLRLVNARANFVALVERRRAAAERRVFQTLRASFERTRR